MSRHRAKARKAGTRRNDRAESDGDETGNTWWRYAGEAKNLYEAIEDLERVIVAPRVSKFPLFCFADTGGVFSEQIVVVASSDAAVLALLQSSVHSVWTVANQSSLETRGRYTPSGCFETFPWPTQLRELARLGEALESNRIKLTRGLEIGLTKLYNRVHDPEDRDRQIVAMRELIVAMDRAVADAYGWSSLDIEHGFHVTKQGVRYTVSERVRNEVLARLLQLNHERFDEEARTGLHPEVTDGQAAGAVKAKKPRTKKASADQKGWDF